MEDHSAVAVFIPPFSPSGSRPSDKEEVREYEDFMSEIDLSTPLTVDTLLMKEYKTFLRGAVLKSKELCKRSPVAVAGLERGGAVVTYYVTVGPFVLELRMLNVDWNCDIDDS